MSLYQQEAEVRLLERILPMLSCRVVLDVGAELGSFTAAMLAAGAEAVHAFEPEPRNVEALRDRFEGDRRVTVNDFAISDADGGAELHLSTDASGEPIGFFHSLLDLPDADEVMWRERIGVNTRSIGSLVADRTIPARVGVLKVDTEGHDIAVVAGLGDLDCDVIMTEHWQELPHSLGLCPWTIDEIHAHLASRGFSHFAFVVHRGERTILQWDDARISSGGFGNLLFLHDRVLQQLLPEVLESASMLARELIEDRAGPRSALGRPAHALRAAAASGRRQINETVRMLQSRRRRPGGRQDLS